MFWGRHTPDRFCFRSTNSSDGAQVRHPVLRWMAATLPGNRLEALKGHRQGQYSIRINDQWRICFEWPKNAPGPSNVEIVDYH
jgi:hypothetical protein